MKKNESSHSELQQIGNIELEKNLFVLSKITLWIFLY